MIRISLPPIYVSPTGDDSNDGMSSDSPVKSIMHALELCEQMGQARSEIYLAAGTYDGNIEFLHQNYELFISGAVIINGQISMYYSSLDIIPDQNFSNDISLSINGGISLAYCSNVIVNQIPTTITANNRIPLSVSYLSGFNTSSSLTINASNALYVINITYSSIVTLQSDNSSLILNGSNVASYAIFLYYGSTMYVRGSTTIQKKSGSSTGFVGAVNSAYGSNMFFTGDLDIKPGCISGYCISAVRCSTFVTTSAATINGGGARLLNIEECSKGQIGGETTFNLETASTNCVYSTSNSILNLFGNTTINAPSGGGAAIFNALAGNIEIANRTIKINGSWANTVMCNGNGYFYLNPSGTIALQSGASVASKGVISYGGILCVSGANPENKIPGTNSFTISTGGLIG